MNEPEWMPTVTLHGEPASKARPRLGKGGNVYTPGNTTAAEDRWKWELRASGYTEPNADSAYAVRLRFYSGVWTRKDIDNMVKLVLDAANKLVWADDRQVVGIDAWLIRGDDRPRTELALRLVDQPLSPTIPCGHCGTEVAVKVNRQRDGSDKRTRFCSIACAHAAKRETRTCPKCGKEFTAPASDRARFCSRACAGTSGGMPSSVTPDQLARAVALMAAGKSQTAAAAEVGADKNALGRAIVKASRL